MSQDATALRANFSRLLHAAFAISAEIMVAVVVLAFMHNWFSVDIHINHARHEVAVQLIVNDVQHMPVQKLLKLAGYYFNSQGLAAF